MMTTEKLDELRATHLYGTLRDKEIDELLDAVEEFQTTLAIEANRKRSIQRVVNNAFEGGSHPLTYIHDIDDLLAEDPLKE